MTRELLYYPPSLSLSDIMRQPLPHQSEKRINRILVRAMTYLARKYVIGIEGDLNILREPADPFVVVLNHNQRLESVLIPSLLFFYRGGKPIHFLADWNFLMMPLVATLYRRSQSIIVTNKDAKPRFLNVLKPLFKEEVSAFDRALACLHRGGSVGIFPEGTVNRDPDRLMRGLSGAARLSVLSGAPVVPMGIRFPELLPGQPIPDGARMRLHVGTPMVPPRVDDASSAAAEVASFHSMMMQQLAELSGKSWHPQANKRRRYVS